MSPSSSIRLPLGDASERAKAHRVWADYLQFLNELPDQPCCLPPTDEEALCGVDVIWRLEDVSEPADLEVEQVCAGISVLDLNRSECRTYDVDMAEAETVKMRDEVEVYKRQIVEVRVSLHNS